MHIKFIAMIFENSLRRIQEFFLALESVFSRSSLVGFALVLAGCSATPHPYALQERFGSGDMHSRLFDATPEQTCEAGRRALLSQGYLISVARQDMVEGVKSFQPDAESHMQMTIRVVCVPDGGRGSVTLGFVTGVQDSYTVKKGNSSASVGVPALGSVSLPFMAGSESLVKVASQTINAEVFYDRFFDIVKRYLLEDTAAVPDGQAPAPK